MRNVAAISRRIIKQFLRDKRSLALLVAAPILVFTLTWLVLDENDYEPKIAFEHLPIPIEQALQNELAEDLLHMSETEAMELFYKGEADAFITVDVEDQKLRILLEGSDPTVGSAVQKAVQAALRAIHSESFMDLTVERFHGSEDFNLFDQVGAVLIGFFVFFFVFIIGGISFLRERTQGTLEKLLSTPIKRWEIVAGYLLGFGLFTIIQSFLIAAYAVYVLDVWMAGDFWQLIIVTFLLAVTALTLATLLSAFANNEFQMMQFIPLVILPQVFFSGIFNLASMDRWLQAFSKLMPLTYGAEAMQGIMIKGKNLWDVWDDLAILLGFAALFFILNIFALKKHRRL